MDKIEKYRKAFGEPGFAFEYVNKLVADEYKKMQEYLKQKLGTDTMDKKQDE